MEHFEELKEAGKDRKVFWEEVVVVGVDDLVFLVNYGKIGFPGWENMALVPQIV